MWCAERVLRSRLMSLSGCVLAKSVCEPIVGYVISLPGLRAQLLQRASLAHHNCSWVPRAEAHIQI